MHINNSFFFFSHFRLLGMHIKKTESLNRFSFEHSSHHVYRIYWNKINAEREREREKKIQNENYCAETDEIPNFEAGLLKHLLFTNSSSFPSLPSLSSSSYSPSSFSSLRIKIFASGFELLPI